MVFTSEAFVFWFLPLALLAYHSTGRRNAVLLVASYLFYGWWDPRFVLLMLFVTVVNFAGGNAVAGMRPGDPRRFGVLAISVTVSLLTLGFFKYAGFFQDNLNRALAGLGLAEVPVLQVVLPVGISFYVFQSISYAVDVYRGHAPPARSFVDFACFVSLFPQLIAGPIVRYRTIAGQLVARTHDASRLSAGTALFVLGFAKKVLLADPMGRAADAAFLTEGPAAIDAWFGIAAYSFQIYFDFAGYSDMAIGLGRLFGFELPRNFDAPYRATSITGFWRRWHISLSTFLRDYLYIPLGGNRRGLGRTYANLMVVMLLGGLWHGAAWTFVLWGALHGALLSVERACGRRPLPGPRAVRVGSTFVLLMLTWVLFRAENLEAALAYYGALSGLAPTGVAAPLLAGELHTTANLLTLGLCALLVWQPVQGFDWVRRITWTRAWTLLLLFFVAVGQMVAQAHSPFLYFRF